MKTFSFSGIFDKPEDILMVRHGNICYCGLCGSRILDVTTYPSSFAYHKDYTENCIKSVPEPKIKIHCARCGVLSAVDYSVTSEMYKEIDWEVYRRENMTEKEKSDFIRDMMDAYAHSSKAKDDLRLEIAVNKAKYENTLDEMWLKSFTLGNIQLMEYTKQVNTIKSCGCKVLRNSKGKHKIVIGG